MLTETTTLMGTQEYEEMMEHVDEVDFALDGLRRGQPVRIRHASLLSLLMVSATLQQTRLLRTHGMANTVIDTPSNLAAAALFFVLTSDGQDDSPKVIHFLLKLLKPVTKQPTKSKLSNLGNKLVALSNDTLIFNDGKGDESSFPAILQKVEEVLVSCKELKSRSGSDSEMKRPELNPKWIALLTDTVSGGQEVMLVVGNEVYEGPMARGVCLLTWEAHLARVGTSIGDAPHPDNQCAALRTSVG